MQRVLHVITSLDADGAQTLLMDFASHCPRDRCENVVAYLLGPGGLRGEQRYAGVEVVDLTRGSVFTFASLWRLARLVRRRRFDIVHTHLVHGGILGRLAAWLGGARFVVTTRHYGTEQKERSLLYRLEDRLTRRSHRVIAISGAVQRHLVDRGIAPAGRIRVVRNAMDLDLFGAEPVLPPLLDGQPPVLGSIGRLRPQKGYHHLLDAFRLVLNDHPGARLEIVGEGPLRGELEAQVASLGMGGSVSLLGRVPHGEIPDRIDHWDLFILSSVWEGFGMVLVEAMARARATVATRVEGVLEVVDDGVTGLLVPPADPRALATAVNGLLADPERLEAMGRAGRQRAVARFSTERFVDETLAVYEELSGEER